jgi:hypothetical protein
MSAWKALFDAAMANHCESVNQSGFITGFKILCSNFIVLANQENCLNMCKAMIKEAKGNAEQLRDTNACPGRALLLG